MTNSIAWCAFISAITNALEKTSTIISLKKVQALANMREGVTALSGELYTSRQAE